MLLNSIIISNSYCVGTSPLIYTSDKMDRIITFENVYTSNEDYDNSVSGLKKLTEEQMKGENAEQYMEGFDFDTVWKTTESGYPENFIYVRPDYVWDGTTASEFAGGSGEKDDPYLIETGAQLYKMVKEFTNSSTASGSSNKLTVTYEESPADDKDACEAKNNI